MALTRDRRGRIHEFILEQQFLPVAAGAQVFLGALVSLGAAGQAEPAADSAAQADKAVFFALEACDNRTGQAGDKRVLCMTRGTVLLPRGTLTQVDAGKIAHVVDDADIALNSQNQRPIGRITRITGDQVAVAL